MERTCVILQPSYIPWRGYFHQIQKADVFVFYDDVQYDRHGWRNRNRIKTPRGPEWLTIPVFSKGHLAEGRSIDSIVMDNRNAWWASHTAKLAQSYARAPHYDVVQRVTSEMYETIPEKLADFTIASTITIARQLGLEKTSFVRSSQIPSSGKKTDRIISLLQSVGASRYVSGPSARSYLDEAALAAAGISLEYMEYEYPAYEQLHGAYDPFVSILDLLAMTGASAPDFIWGHS